LVNISGNNNSPWEEPPIALQGTMLTSEDEKLETRFLPMGHSKLRRVAFPLSCEIQEKCLKKVSDKLSEEEDPMFAF